MWLHYYYNIYLIKTKGQQSRRLLPTHPSLQPKRKGNLQELKDEEKKDDKKNQTEEEVEEEEEERKE